MAQVAPELRLAVVAETSDEQALVTADAAVEWVRECYARLGGAHPSPAEGLSRLVAAVHAARERAEAGTPPEPRISLVALVACHGYVAAARLGGARCFLLRGPRMAPLVSEPDDDVATFAHACRPGDAYLLCTDGLWGTVGVETMGAVLAVCEDPAEACDRLVGAAWAAGGLDEIAVAVVRIVAPEEA